jgi:murein DD-endopeptidase MepM/ murein hydrolase activator NlpD
MRRFAFAWILTFALAATADAVPDDWMVDPDPLRVGEIFRVTLRLPPGQKTGTVSFRGHTVPGFNTGGLLNAYLGVDLDVEAGAYDVEYRAGELAGVEKVHIEAREFASESLTVDSEYVGLDDATRARVEREAKRLDALWGAASGTRLWTKGFVQPAAGDLGSAFGSRRSFNDEARSRHGGLDILAPPGSGVYAANTGNVVLAEELFYTGTTVILDHGLGLYTLYGHLAELTVEAGASVGRAQQLGVVGATGRVTGPHLHWEVRAAGARVDPMTLPGMPRP